MLDKYQDKGLVPIVRLISLMSLLLFLSACASNVIVKTNFPKPLVGSLPLNGQLTYTDDFKEYTYFESAKERRSLKSLDMADAQMALFDTIFTGLINMVDADGVKVDLHIVPEVLDFQYSAPAETQLKHYEVWIKYRLKINNGANQKIADWIIKGYGKTPTGFLTSNGVAFSAAATVALRDVGAQIAIQFPSQKVIKQLLNGESPDVIEALSDDKTNIQTATVLESAASDGFKEASNDNE